MAAQDTVVGVGEAETAHPVKINYDWCKKCGICIAFCPHKVLKLGAKGYPQPVDRERCTHCKLCERMCPDFAVSVADRVKPGAKTKRGEAQ